MAQTTANLVGSLQVSNSRLISHCRRHSAPSTDHNHEECRDTAFARPSCGNVHFARSYLSPTVGSVTRSESRIEAGPHPCSPARKPINKWKRPHRIVGQMDDEPLGIIVFKWILIIAGALMLGAVVVIMSEVIYSWLSGDLAAKHLNATLTPRNRTFGSDNDNTTIQPLT